MVANDRLDFYLDARTDIEAELEKGYVETASVDLLDIASLEIYMAFSSNFKGRLLRDIWDRRMKELDASGELRAFYNKYESYTSFYPFSQKSASP